VAHVTGFQHDIAGGSGNLIVTSVQSPNFTLSPFVGWQIARNGNAYFANATISGTITSSQIIGDGTGDEILIYDGTPATNTLIYSLSSIDTTDPYGNAVNEGSTFYAGNSPYLATVYGPDNTIVYSSTAGQHSWVEVNQLGPGNSASDKFAFLPLTASTTTIVVDGTINAALPGTETVAETWHSIGMMNSWVTVATFVAPQYRMTASPPNTMEVIGTINATSATTAVFGTVPTAYYPAHTQQFACACNSLVPSGDAPGIQCDTAGNLSVAHTDSVPNNFTLFFHGFISLDA
jgi:hypothetical protein